MSYLSRLGQIQTGRTAPSLLGPVTSPDTLAISTNSENTASARLPQAMGQAVVISGSYTATGTITGGKSLDNAIKNLIVGSQGRPLVQSLQNETDFVIKAIKDDGPTAGFDDGETTTPTTAVALPVTMRFDGPFDFSRYGNPVVYIDVDPAQLGTITGFSLSFHVTVLPYKGGPPQRNFRSFATSAAPSLYMGPGPIDDIFLLVGAASALTSVVLYNAGLGIKAAYTSSADIQYLANNWAQHVAAAVSATPVFYYVKGIHSAPFANRNINLTLASSQNVTVIATGPDTGS